MSKPRVEVNRPNTLAVGTIVWLSSELMFFAGLFAMYFSHRSASGEIWPENTALLNFPFALTNTTILVLSSVTCQMGVWAAEKFRPRRSGSLLDVRRWGAVEWFTLTYLMGSVFIAGQIIEYAELVHHGLHIGANPYASVFYITTGFHGLHVIGGLVAFLFVLGRIFFAKRFTHHEANTAIVCSYYWHFVDVVWIALFIIIYVIQ
ncbi:MAG: heme-copper oxidase subunit III [Bowdeniella nasicola]|nr:heme-copper oxidase subunit III [Bowdeniella nasicola]